MLKVLCIGIFLIFSLHNVIGQPKDPSQSVVLQIAYDTSYVLEMITRGGDYQNSFVDSAIYFADKAMTVSRKIKYEKGELYCLNLEGVVFLKLGNYSKALEIFLKALKIGERNKFAKGTSMVLTNLGDLYFKQGEVRTALDYTFKAKDISAGLHDSVNLCAGYLNIGNYYEAINYLDSARLNTQMAYELALKMKDENYTGSTLNNLGNINAKAKQYTLAMEYYRVSLPYFVKTEDYDGLCESYMGLAKVFWETNNKDSALYYARSTYATAAAQKFTKYIYNASQLIVQYYQATRQIDSAYAYQQTMIAAKDSLFSQEKVKQIQNLSIGENLRQQELAEEKLKAIEERKNNLQYMAIAAFIFLFGLVILLTSRRRIKVSTINFMVTVALLLTFEFISLFIHPYILTWTHHSPILMLLILVVVAAILVPMHHRLEHWIKDRLAYKIIHPRTKKMVMKKGEE